MAYKIVIDAGHGGYDDGAQYEGRKEKDDTLTLALLVGTILMEKGVNVIFTRTNDVYETPAQKANKGNEAEANYFVSIHRNSSLYPNEYTGVDARVYSRQGSAAIMAKNINNQLEQVGFANIGIFEQPNLVVLSKTKMPSVLVEVGYINNDADNALLDAKTYEVAQAIATGILETLY